MKTILTLLLTCVASFAATTYPVITDNANRQFTGGATNLSLLNGTNVFGGTNRYTGTVIITNAASTLSGNGAGMTNLAAGNIASGSLSDARLSANVPLLNGTNVFTGTNTFTAANFFPANNIGARLLWSSPTNLYFATIVTNAGANLTNNGDFVNCTQVAQFTIPPLLGSNSAISLVYTALRTNANSSIANVSGFIGSNTNCIGYSGFSATSRGIANGVFVNFLQSAGSWTQQVAGANFVLQISATNFCDTSVSNTVYLGAWTTANHTNFNIVGLKVYELIAP